MLTHASTATAVEANPASPIRAGPSYPRSAKSQKGLKAVSGATAITGDIIWLIIGVLGAVGGLWWRIEARLSAQDRERESLKSDLSEYKLYVERNHVSAQVLKDTEKRLIDAIEKLASRLEAIADRFDTKRT